MTQAQRDQLAMPVVLVYWLLLVGGLVVYALLRLDDVSSILPLWVGAVSGTMLGQALALHDYRLGVTAILVALLTAIGAQFVPLEFGGRALWLAFVPAALCGYWSLGDRSALAAYWFPSVIWMLSILDRSDGALAPDGAGIALLALLAVLFVAFLRARESRRVGLWRTVAAVPLAPAAPVELLRAPPTSQLARAGWGLSVSAITVAITAWVAPALWQIEPLAPHREPVAQARRRLGLPCCPVAREAEVESARVREYFDLGRRHDRRAARLRDPLACIDCSDRERDAWREGSGSRAASASAAVSPRPVLATPVAPNARVSAPAGTATPSMLSREPVESTPAPVAAGAQELPVVSRATTPAPARPPVVETPHSPRLGPFEPTPTPAPTPMIASPRAAPSREPTADPEPRAGAGPIGPSLLRWLLWLASGAMIFQLVGLTLRPVRRFVTLRHLRRPFWDETIVQRVSNSWQLALVGLRDAGWRPGASEAPQELARRVGVDGLERCATILERARHGIAIESDDVREMQAAADAAYRAARCEVPRFTRALGWLRWPLI